MMYLDVRQAWVMANSEMYLVCPNNNCHFEANFSVLKV